MKRESPIICLLYYVLAVTLFIHQASGFRNSMGRRFMIDVNKFVQQPTALYAHSLEKHKPNPDDGGEDGKSRSWFQWLYKRRNNYNDRTSKERNFGQRLRSSSSLASGSVIEDAEESDVEGDGFRLTFLAKCRRRLNAITRYRDPGTLILVRHGESTLNYNKTFTGWTDTDLCDRGVQEMFHASHLLLERGYQIDVTYTSRLKRAIRSAWIMYSEIGSVYRPVYKSWRLNERMYGALEGMSKPGSAEVYGQEVIQAYRTGLSARPPAMTPDHPNWHHNERKYADLDPANIPVTESLQDTMDRTLPLWYTRILPDLLAGRTVMIVAHANSLRGIVKHIDNLSAEEIQKIGIPNGIPLVYKFNKNMEPIKQDNAALPLTGEFLEKKGILRAALDREAALAEKVPGLGDVEPKSRPKDSSGGDVSRAQYTIYNNRVRTLSLLEEQRQKMMTVDSSGISLDVDRPSGINILESTDKMYSSSGKSTAEAPQPHATKYSKFGGEIDGCGIFDKDAECVEGNEHKEKTQMTNVITYNRKGRSKDLDDPFIVMIRHGRTEYNKLGIFTGWEDAPLAREGRAEARTAGRLIKMHGIEFDMVYTSWLSRAIETAWLVLDELDCLWLPIVKTWRLNERMYGALTGLSKKMIAQRHGRDQFMKWRRGYDQRPPSVSSFSSNYPGNDDRYTKYARDVRYSVFESLIRSISHKRVELHRKFPKTESLQDCMQRTIPFFTGKPLSILSI